MTDINEALLRNGAKIEYNGQYRDGKSLLLQHAIERLKKYFANVPFHEVYCAETYDDFDTDCERVAKAYIDQLRIQNELQNS